jgi:3',5'-cyclic AMP phosphodiesterase CpdA
MKRTLFLLVLATIVMHMVTGCKKDKDPDPEPVAPTNLQIACFSDPHYHDPSLGISGAAFEAYLMTDRKMIAQSRPIAESVVTTLKNSTANVVLVAGDLTKDGEKLNHEKFAQLLSQLESAGKRVFVIPGNHDVNNPQAYSYDGSNVTPVATVTAGEFATIYSQYGYSEALYRDPNSLGYVASLNTTTWLLAMDACRYSENDSFPVTGGKLSDASYSWIKEKLAEAKTKNIRVIGMIHHGIVEHYAGQSLMFSEYLLENWSEKSAELASLGLNIVFTGHFHAQDIAKKDNTDGTFIVDIETGSLVTWPVPYRMMTLTTDNKLKITTSHVTTLSGYADFEGFSRTYLQAGMDTLVKMQLMYPPYNLPYDQTALISPLVVGGFMAHYHGDEVIDPATQGGINLLLGMGGAAAQVGGSIQWMFTDTQPADQNIEIDLLTGTISPL